MKEKLSFMWGQHRIYAIFKYRCPYSNLIFLIKVLIEISYTVSVNLRIEESEIKAKP